MNEIILNIFVILVLICALGVLWYKGKKDLVKKIILNLVIQAERLWGSGTGKIKLTEVIASAYSKLPWIIRVFVTTETLKRWIEEAVQYIKIEVIKEGKTIERLLSSDDI